MGVDKQQDISFLSSKYKLTGDVRSPLGVSLYGGAEAGGTDYPALK